MFAPNTLPMAISNAPILAAVKVATNSGREVDIATKNEPTKVPPNPVT